MNSVFDNYARLMLEWFRRRKEDGPLGEVVELDYMGRLDDLYWELSDQERQQVEDRFSRPMEDNDVVTSNG